ncbi:unnamed protein product [Lactuca saligna]|uniref:Uncharacterized protein n=1 Tax=Lactuca saligna TaxID=75948 RepID=A0AA36E6Y4_LACSI|nr:unnamed protein product [Lactuca saligna]
MVNKYVASGRFDLQEPSVMAELTQAMHASVKTFIKMVYASLLHLVELDLKGVCQLCCHPNVEDNPPEGDFLKVGSSSITLVLGHGVLHSSPNNLSDVDVVTSRHLGPMYYLFQGKGYEPLMP